MAHVSKRTPLAERLLLVRQRIASAARTAGRSPEEITLIAVTKNAAPEQMREIIQLGATDLGESRVQVLSQRAAQMNEFYLRTKARLEPPPPADAKLRWHMIGHLQRNKVKGVLSIVDLIHSVDSLRLAEEIDIAAEKTGRKMPVLLQLNAGEEESKFGVAVGAAVHLAEQMDTMPHVQLIGLMTMAPLTADVEKARRVFARTREIFEEMKWHKIGGGMLRHLSMGMSNDFEAAIAEGSTMVRIGSLLFGGPQGADSAEET